MRPIRMRQAIKPMRRVTGDRINNTGGAVPFVEGIKGQAASFDGKSGLSLGKGLITQNAYTVAFWINPAELRSVHDGLLQGCH